MNKFLKGTIVCAAVVPFAFGLMGCSDKKKEYEPSKAYTAVMESVGAMTFKMLEMDKPNSKFQLNINMNFEYNQFKNGIKNNNESFEANLKAVIASRHVADNKQIIGNVSVKGENEQYISLLNAYIVDDIDTIAALDMDEYSLVIVESANWETYVGKVYIKDGDNFVLAEENFDAEAEYYLHNQDLMHAYLMVQGSVLDGYKLIEVEPADWDTDYTNYYKMCEIYRLKTKHEEYEANKYYYLDNYVYKLVTSAVEPIDWAVGDYYVTDVGYTKLTDEQTPTFSEGTYYQKVGMDLNSHLKQMGLTFPIPNSKVYATLDIGLDNESSGDNLGDSSGDMDISNILEGVQALDYNTFIASFAGTGANISAKAVNGEVSLKISNLGTQLEFVAKQDGGVEIRLSFTSSSEGITEIANMIIEIDMLDDFDETFIPTDIPSYGDEPLDLEELLDGIINGM